MEEPPELAYDVAAALFAMGDTSLMPAIVETLNTATSARARSAAARALGGAGTDDRRTDDPLFVWEDDKQRLHVCL